MPKCLRETYLESSHCSQPPLFFALAQSCSFYFVSVLLRHSCLVACFGLVMDPCPLPGKEGQRSVRWKKGSGDLTAAQTRFSQASRFQPLLWPHFPKDLLPFLSLWAGTSERSWPCCSSFLPSVFSRSFSRDWEINWHLPFCFLAQKFVALHPPPLSFCPYWLLPLDSVTAVFSGVENTGESEGEIHVFIPPFTRKSCGLRVFVPFSS